MKTRVILRYFGTYCLWKRFLDYKSPNTPSNLICLKFLELQVLSNCFSLKLEQLSWKESLKICLTCELLFLSFHWGWNLVLEEFQICFRTFFRKIKKVLAEIWLFLNNLVVNKEKKQKKTLQTIIFIIFSDILMFYQTILPPQVKRCAIIIYKHGIYQLSHEWPNELKLRILQN